MVEAKMVTVRVDYTKDTRGGGTKRHSHELSALPADLERVVNKFLAKVEEAGGYSVEVRHERAVVGVTP